MATTIQITKNLQEELNKKKIFDRETYEEVIWDLIEDTKELSKETKKLLIQAEKEIKEGKIHKWSDIKKELNLNV